VIAICYSNGEWGYVTVLENGDMILYSIMEKSYFNGEWRYVTVMDNADGE